MENYLPIIMNLIVDTILQDVDPLALDMSESKPWLLLIKIYKYLPEHRSFITAMRQFRSASSKCFVSYMSIPLLCGLCARCPPSWEQPHQRYKKTRSTIVNIYYNCTLSKNIATIMPVYEHNKYKDLRDIVNKDATQDDSYYYKQCISKN